MNILNSFCKALCLFLLIQSAFAQQDKFTEQLIKGRYELRLEQSRLSGSGAPVLEKAIGDADFVMIGEDHGIAQIPQFVGAVCDLLGPKGLHTMAVETGPLVAHELEKWSQSSDGRFQVSAFVKKYPETIPFYDYQEEFDLLTHCAHSATGGRFHLWGLDQEFMGSSGFIFDQILATQPGRQAEAAFRKLAKQNDEARARAATTGNPEMLFMLSAQESRLNSARDLLNKEGSRAAQHLFASFLESRSIYQKLAPGICEPGTKECRRRAHGFCL